MPNAFSWFVREGAQGQPVRMPGVGCAIWRVGCCESAVPEGLRTRPRCVRVSQRCDRLPQRARRGQRPANGLTCAADMHAKMAWPEESTRGEASCRFRSRASCGIPGPTTPSWWRWPTSVRVCGGDVGLEGEGADARKSALVPSLRAPVGALVALCLARGKVFATVKRGGWLQLLPLATGWQVPQCFCTLAE